MVRPPGGSVSTFRREKDGTQFDAFNPDFVDF
jgi:hypothetical protein